MVDVWVHNICNIQYQLKIEKLLFPKHKHKYYNIRTLYIDLSYKYINMEHTTSYFDKSNIDYILKYMNSTNIWIQHINSSPGRHVSLLIKVIWLTALFSNSKHLLV